MSPGKHERTHGPAQEIQRLRGELSELHRLLGEHFAADPGPQVREDMAKEWSREAYEHGRDAGLAEPAERPEPQDIDPPGTNPAVEKAARAEAERLDRLRYPPDGRQSWINREPREGADFPGMEKDPGVTDRIRHVWERWAQDRQREAG